MIVRHRYPTFFDAAAVDRRFGDLVGSLFETPSFGPAVRADWAGDDYVITVDLPGVPAEHVGVEVAGNTLTLSATSGESTWSRAFRLGGSLDPQAVGARYLDGRLTVTIGKVAAPQARQVSIDTAPAPAAIETQSADEQAGDQSSEANSAG